jgi:hypothetical protein
LPSTLQVSVVQGFPSSHVGGHVVGTFAVEPVEPVEPAESVEPVEPVESVEPVEPVESVEPPAPVEPPAGPGHPQQRPVRITSIATRKRVDGRPRSVDFMCILPSSSFGFETMDVRIRPPREPLAPRDVHNPRVDWGD